MFLTPAPRAVIHLCESVLSLQLGEGCSFQQRVSTGEELETGKAISAEQNNLLGVSLMTVLSFICISLRVAYCFSHVCPGLLCNTEALSQTLSIPKSGWLLAFLKNQAQDRLKKPSALSALRRCAYLPG